MATMADKWLHLAETGIDPWVLPILTAVHRAKETGRASPMTRELSEMAMHISTRLAVLPRVIRRLNKDIAALLRAATEYKTDHVFSRAKPAAALRVNDDLKYYVVADVDSFLFEVNACSELMQTFFE